MDITIHPGKLKGNITAVPSKSQAHRLLICSAFSDAVTQIQCPETNADIEATVRCLNALGADISRSETGYCVHPVSVIPHCTAMDCGESGSTLRFILPIVCALGVEATIHMSGRLPHRPLVPLWEELERMGCHLTRPAENTIHTSGKLRAGKYVIPGNISSQFVSGLMLGLALLDDESNILIEGRLESKPYVEMTQKALSLFGVSTDHYRICGHYPFRSPGNISVEGDWSNSAFFLAAASLGNNVTVQNLDVNSSQGDRVIMDILNAADDPPTISAADIPDLVPILAVYFAARKGVMFTDIARLRLKESDRVESVKIMLQSLGIQVSVIGNTLTVIGGQIKGGIVNACADHRIVMAAAIAATIAAEPVTIHGAESVDKSYPTFWRDFERLGGKYEQYIR